MALVRCFEQRYLKWPQSQGKRSLSCQAGFMLELPSAAYQDQNLAPTLKVAWPEDDFLRYFYSSRGIYAAWRVFKRDRAPTATIAPQTRRLLLGLRM